MIYQFIQIVLCGLILWTNSFGVWTQQETVISDGQAVIVSLDYDDGHGEQKDTEKNPLPFEADEKDADEREESNRDEFVKLHTIIIAGLLRENPTDDNPSKKSAFTVAATQSHHFGTPSVLRI